jgi:hypothetical protein
VILGCCGSSSASTGIKKSSVNTLMMRCCSWSSRLISPPIRFYDVGDQRELKSFSRRRRKPLSYCDATLSPRLVHPQPAQTQPAQLATIPAAAGEGDIEDQLPWPVDAILEAACAALTPRTLLAYLCRATALLGDALLQRILPRSQTAAALSARGSPTTPSPSSGTCAPAAPPPVRRRAGPVRLPRIGRSRSGDGEEIFEEKAAGRRKRGRGREQASCWEKTEARAAPPSEPPPSSMPRAYFFASSLLALFFVGSGHG